MNIHNVDNCTTKHHSLKTQRFIHKSGMDESTVQMEHYAESRIMSVSPLNRPAEADS